MVNKSFRIRKGKILFDEMELKVLKLLNENKKDFLLVILR